MLETELYSPIKDWLEAQDYVVRGEVKHCDLVAEKNGELVVIELKVKPSLKLLYQAVDRLKLTDQVYVALPGTTRSSRALSPFIRVLRLTGIGLILVHQSSLQARVEVRCLPKIIRPKKSARKQQQLMSEFSKRQSVDTPGGSQARPLVTVYREEAILVFAVLEKLGQASPRKLKSMGCSQKAGAILRDNHYGWFERIDRGVYRCCSEADKTVSKAFPETLAACRQHLETQTLT